MSVVQAYQNPILLPNIFVSTERTVHSGHNKMSQNKKDQVKQAAEDDGVYVMDLSRPAWCADFVIDEILLVLQSVPSQQHI